MSNVLKGKLKKYLHEQVFCKSHKKILRLTVASLGLLAIATGTAGAQLTKTSINVAALATYPPFQYKDPASNTLMGFDIDLFNAVAEKMGAKVNWIETSFNQFISSIQTKRVDVVLNLADSPERRASLSLVDYMRAHSVFFTSQANASRFPNMGALCGARVGATRSTTTGSWARKWGEEHCTKAGLPPITIVENEHSSDAWMQLSQGRIDVAADVESLVAHSNATEGNRYVVIGKPFYSLLFGIGFAKDDPEIGQAIKKALSEVIADGTYQRLLHKWKIPDDSAIERPTINEQP